MAKKKTESKSVVVAVDMIPFPETVLFIAGDWRDAAPAIDDVLMDKKGEFKISERVLKLIGATDFEFDESYGMTVYRKEITSNLIIILMRELHPQLEHVVHECHHATMMTLRHAGVEDLNNETSAYMLERLFKACMTALKEAK